MPSGSRQDFPSREPLPGCGLDATFRRAICHRLRGGATGGKRCQRGARRVPKAAQRAFQRRRHEAPPKSGAVDEARGGTLRTLKVARFGEIFVRRRLGASANFMASKGIVGGLRPDPGGVAQSPKTQMAPRAIMIHAQPKIPFWTTMTHVILASLGPKTPRHARLLCILETSECAGDSPRHPA